MQAIETEPLYCGHVADNAQKAKWSRKLTFAICGLFLVGVVAATVTLVVLALQPVYFSDDAPSMVESWIQYDGNYHKFGLCVPPKIQRGKRPQKFLYFENGMHKGTDVDPNDSSFAVGWGGGFQITAGEHYSLEYKEDPGKFYINSRAYPLAYQGNVFLIFWDGDSASGANVTHVEVDLSDVSIHVPDPANGFSDEDLTLTRASIEAFAVQNEDIVSFFQKVRDNLS
jgi:hypothetical protein